LLGLNRDLERLTKIFLYGVSGIGKTHILSTPTLALCYMLGTDNPVIYVPSCEFLNGHMSSFMFPLAMALRFNANLWANVFSQLGQRKVEDDVFNVLSCLNFYKPMSLLTSTILKAMI
jgi:hypothetical protein